MMYKDLNLADKTLWEQFRGYWANGQYESALSLLSNTQLSNKALTASAINNITAQLTTLENNDDPAFEANRIVTDYNPPTGMTTGQIYFQIDKAL